MAARKDELGTIKKIAAASGTKLSNGKVGRICKASHTTDIDSLQHLAEVFKVEPWQAPKPAASGLFCVYRNNLVSLSESHPWDLTRPIRGTMLLSIGAVRPTPEPTSPSGSEPTAQQTRGSRRG